MQDEADTEDWASDEHATSRLVRALIAGCQAEPALNASFDAASWSLRENSTINLGLAVDSPEGLFVPVLRDVAHGTAQDGPRLRSAREVQSRVVPLLPQQVFPSICP